MAIKFSPGCKCNCCGSICVRTTVCGQPTQGQTVKVETTGGSPVTIGTGTSTGVVTSVTLGAPGSSFKPGHGYALGFSGGGGSGASGTFDVLPSGAIHNVVLVTGGSGYDSAPTISFPGAGPGSGATATASILIQACFSIPQAASYKITVSNACGSTSTTISATCTANVVTVDAPGATLAIAFTGECGNQFNTFFGTPPAFTITGAGRTITNPGSPQTYCLPPGRAYTITWDNSFCWQAPAARTVNLGCSDTEDFGLIPQKRFNLVLSVIGCAGLPLSGVAISATAGTDTVTGTTNGSGQVTLALKGGCSYTATASKSRFNTDTFGISAQCSDSTGSHVMTAASGYRCCTSVCADPIADTTLTVTDANGAHAATWNGTTGFYEVCYIAPSMTVGCTAGAGGGGLSCDPGGLTYSGQPAIFYRFKCAINTTQVQLQQITNFCTDGAGHKQPVAGLCVSGAPVGQGGPNPPCVNSTGATSGTTTSVTVNSAPSSCAPINAVFTIAGSLVLNGTVTVTE